MIILKIIGILFVLLVIVWFCSFLYHVGKSAGIDGVVNILEEQGVLTKQEADKIKNK